MCVFQSGVRRNGRVVQGYPPIIEEDQKENDEGVPLALSREQTRTSNLRDTDGICPLTRDGQKETKMKTLDPSNLTPR